MLRSVITGPTVCRSTAALVSSSAQLGKLVSYSTIPSAGGDSFDGGHVLVTEQEQGNIQQRIQEAASQVDLDVSVRPCQACNAGACDSWLTCHCVYTPWSSLGRGWGGTSTNGQPTGLLFPQKAG